MSRCTHDGLLLVKIYVGGYDDYTYDTTTGKLEFSDSGNRRDRVAKTGACDICRRRVKLPDKAVNS